MDNSDQKKDTESQSLDSTQVTEGELVADLESTKRDQGSVMVLQSMTSLIRENLAKIAKLTDELKQQKEMLDSVLGNDETYKQHQEAVKAAQKIKNATKQEILKRPEVAHIDAKVKGLTAEIKEAKESLNSYLPEYQRLSGSSEIENENGETMEIVFSAKLVKRRN